jgi:tol-pal system protein YbgF
VLSTGCALYTSKEDGEALRQKIVDLEAAHKKALAEQQSRFDEQLSKFRVVVEDATKVTTRNSADVGLSVQKLQVDVAQLTGRSDDQQHALDALTKQFQDYRASSDSKLETLTNTLTNAKNPPMPETPDALYAEGEKRLAMANWQDARRAFTAFVNRYPTDPRAPKAQYNVGEAWAGEKRWANAIGEYSKVVDNFKSSDVIPDAMYKSGLGFYQIKRCTDAKIWLSELLKRYPKTGWKKDVNDQLKKITKDQRSPEACIQ